MPQPKACSGGLRRAVWTTAPSLAENAVEVADPLLMPAHLVLGVPGGQSPDQPPHGIALRAKIANEAEALGGAAQPRRGGHAAGIGLQRAAKTVKGARTTRAVTVLVVAAAAACSSPGGSGPPVKAATARPVTSPSVARSAQPTVPVNVYAHIRPGMINPNWRGDPVRVCVPNSLSNTVTVINPRTYKVIGEFPVGAAEPCDAVVGRLGVVRQRHRRQHPCPGQPGDRQARRTGARRRSLQPVTSPRMGRTRW